jgi:hypothetical protein
MLCAFDLLELDSEDLRPEPIEKRKDLLAELLRGSHSSIAFNEHFEEDGAIVFREASQARLRGYRVETDRLALSLGAFAALGKGQEPESASGKT